MLASDEFGGGGYGDPRRPRAQTNCPPLTYQPYNEDGAYHSNHFHHAFHKPLQLLTNPPPLTKMGSTHRNSCTSTHISHTSSQTYTGPNQSRKMDRSTCPHPATPSLPLHKSPNPLKRMACVSAVLLQSPITIDGARWCSQHAQPSRTAVANPHPTPIQNPPPSPSPSAQGGEPAPMGRFEGRRRALQRGGRERRAVEATEPGARRKGEDGGVVEEG